MIFTCQIAGWRRETAFLGGLIGILAGALFLFRTAVAAFIAFDHAIDPPTPNIDSSYPPR